MEPVEGQTVRALDLGIVLTKLHRIAELANLSTSRCTTAYRRAANP